MNRGPQAGRRPASTMSEKAAAAWGTAPDWIIALADLADREGLKGAANTLNYSVSVVSYVLNNRYAGDLARVEGTVRGALLGHTVDCPVLGVIGRDRCLREQDEPFRATSAFRAQLYHACRNDCPNARRKGDE